MMDLIEDVFAMFGVIALVIVAMSRSSAFKMREAQMEFLFAMLPAWAVINFGLGAVWVLANLTM